MMPITRLSGRALAALLPSLGDSPGPRYGSLAQATTSLLLDGRIAPGTRLPSERELATVLGLSRATVTAAYDSLRADGLLVSQIGAGSVLALPEDGVGPDGRASRWRTSVLAPPMRRAAGIMTPARPEDGDLLDLSCAVFPAPPELPAAIADAGERIGAHLGGSGYEPWGLPELREAVAARFTQRGVATSADQILITNGAQHGLDLVLRMLVAPGDRVLTELPTYSGLLDAVRASGARTVAVPVDPAGGWQLAAMTAALRQSSPKLAALVPDFHNPTGFLAPAEERRELLRAAARSGTIVLVDESFVELGFVDPEVPTAALDRSVITIGSLSKPVWGGLRIGWIRASRELIHRLVVVRASIDMGQSVFDQLVALAVFPHLNTIAASRRSTVRPQRDFLLGALAEHFPGWRFTTPAGGLSLWVGLDAPLATPLTVQAARYGLRIVAGSRFGIDGTMERFLRLPYALTVSDLAAAVDRLALAWADLDPSAVGYSPLIVA